MSTSKSFLEYALEALSVAGEVTARAMMGEYCLYLNGVLVGGIYDDRVLIKRTKGNAEFGLPEEIPYNGAKPMYMLDPENAEKVEKVLACTYAELSAVPPKPRKKK